MIKKATFLRFCVSLSVLVLGSATVLAQEAPVVSNVTASQRPDDSKLVDIYYDLADESLCTVWVVVSDDGGMTWNVPAQTFTGDVGRRVKVLAIDVDAHTVVAARRRETLQRWDGAEAIGQGGATSANGDRDVATGVMLRQSHPDLCG